ncbi:MAG: hypothetical protein QOE23_281 [Pseudonocardiales bacterium]|nr:hypothetical protein [Pseudonocardiales bacterium]
MSGPPPRYAFADETFRDPRRGQGQPGYYQLAAVLVEGGDVWQFRNDIRAQAGAAGEFKASTLADRGNRQAVADMLDLVCNAPCFNLLVVRNNHQINQERARQECLERLLIELYGQKVFSLTLDSRESIVGPDPQVRNKKDFETRRRLVSAGSIDRNLRMTHLHDYEEQLLWYLMRSGGRTGAISCSETANFGYVSRGSAGSSACNGPLKATRSASPRGMSPTSAGRCASSGATCGVAVTTVRHGWPKSIQLASAGPAGSTPCSIAAGRLGFEPRLHGSKGRRAADYPISHCADHRPAGSARPQQLTRRVARAAGWTNLR